MALDSRGVTPFHCHSWLADGPPRPRSPHDADAWRDGDPEGVEVLRLLWLGTYLGKVRYWRIYMHQTNGRAGGYYLLDTALGLTADGFSVGVLGRAVPLATKMSFAAAATTLRGLLGWSSSTKTIEPAALGLGRHTAAWFEQAPPPPAEDGMFSRSGSTARRPRPPAARSSPGAAANAGRTRIRGVHDTAAGPSGAVAAQRLEEAAQEGRQVEERQGDDERHNLRTPADDRRARRGRAPRPAQPLDLWILRAQAPRHGGRPRRFGVNAGGQARLHGGLGQDGPDTRRAPITRAERRRGVVDTAAL